MFKTLFEETLELFKQSPWYINIGIIAGFLITVLIILAILIIMPEITKSLFAADIAALGFTLYIAISNHLFSADIIITIVLLCIAFPILLFLLYCADEYYEENIGWIIFNAFFNGLWNICLISCFFLLFIFPFACKASAKNDRYR